MNRIFFLSISAALIISCSSAPKIPKALQLPATYSGEIPCADCMNISYELILQENLLFKESRIYIGKSDSIFTETGRWHVKNDSVIVIEKKDEGDVQFLIDSAVLIMLDRDGNRIVGGTAEMYYLKLGSKKNLAQLSADTDVDPYVSKRVAGIDFIAGGNQPSWSLEMNFESKMHFKALDGADIFLEIPNAVPEGNTMIYAAEYAGKPFEAIVITEACSDNMSGKKKELRVICNYDGMSYSGCGTYLNEKYALNGAWQLHMLLGADLKNVNKPTLIFDVAKNNVSGNSSCNSFAGTVKITESEISISDKLQTTLMACPGNLEQQYMQAINGRTYKYMFANNTLRLIADDVVTMDFVRPAAQ